MNGVNDRSGLGGYEIAAAPPSTHLFDLNVKRQRYEVAGCPAYWVIDPGLRGEPPQITAWELRDDAYVEVGHAEGDVVLNSTYGGTEVKYGGTEYLILSARDVLAIVG